MLQRTQPKLQKTSYILITISFIILGILLLLQVFLVPRIELEEKKKQNEKVIQKKLEKAENSSSNESKPTKDDK